jgi:hypothetical protein
MEMFPGWMIWFGFGLKYCCSFFGVRLRGSKLRGASRARFRLRMPGKTTAWQLYKPADNQEIEVEF